MTLKKLNNLLKTCKNELHDNDELINKLNLLIKSRKKTHLDKLIKLVNNINEKKTTLKELYNIEKKLNNELNNDHHLFDTLNILIKNREKNYKKPLSNEYKELLLLVQQKKKKSSNKKKNLIRKFIEKCSNELNDNDVLLLQAKSLYENNILLNNGIKKISIDNNDNSIDKNNNNNVKKSNFKTFY